MRRACGCHLRRLILLPLIWMMPDVTGAQVTRFVAVGGGASFPTGDAGGGMQTGWLAEVMGGVALPGNVVSVRMGASYGQNRMDGVAGGTSNMMGTGAGETDRTIGAMAGVMVMPNVDRDVIPYALTSAGVMHSGLGGSGTSFAWAAGVGARLQTDIAEFYVECRLAQTRWDGGARTMIPITAGMRIAHW